MGVVGAAVGVRGLSLHQYEPELTGSTVSILGSLPDNYITSRRTSHSETEKETGRQTDRQIDRQTDRQKWKGVIVRHMHSTKIRIDITVKDADEKG